jgi:hypothetical protein
MTDLANLASHRFDCGGAQRIQRPDLDCRIQPHPGVLATDRKRG